MSEAATADAAAEMQAARERMRQRMGAVGGKGRKGVARVNARPLVTAPKNDGNERLKTALKKLGMQTLPSVNEVVLYRSDNSCMVFSQVHPTFSVQSTFRPQPKVSIAPHSNCTQVTGQYVVREEETQMADLLNKIKMMQPGLSGMKAPVAGAAADDDDVPDLVDDFEAVATGEKKIDELD